MKAKELLEKFEKLDGIYRVIGAEIEAYCIDVNYSIIENWTNRKKKIQLELINQFKKDCEKRAYPNKEADGYIFCGKCGTAI